MHDSQKDLDIAKNIKLIEWMRTELLDNVSGLFRGFQQGSEVLLRDCLVNIVILCYLLAKRLGLRYSQFDDLIVNRIKDNEIPAQNTDVWQTDLAILEQHFDQRK